MEGLQGLAVGLERYPFVRVVTWNLGFWLYRTHHDAAWRHLRDVLQPDIALLQEVREVSLAAGEARVFQRVTRSWGTAIVARHGSLTPIEIPVDLGGRTGYVIGARWHRSGEEDLVVVSVHAPIIGGRVFPYLDRIFSAIKLAVGDHNAIVGGDLNTARLAEKVWPGYGHGEFWAQVERGPFVDCFRKFHAEERQTVFRPRAVHAFQDDHLFASREVAARVRSCDAVDCEETRRVSDHIPLLAELD